MKERYGKKLGKIGLTLNIPCPNDPPCIFCNKDSFIPETIKGAVTVKEQMEQGFRMLSESILRMNLSRIFRIILRLTATLSILRSHSEKL
jgi:radical SAM superfamily enzyme